MAYPYPRGAVVCAALAGLRDSRRKVDRDDPHTPSTGDFWTRPLPYGPSLQSTQRPRGLSNRLHRSELQSSIANQLIRLGDSPIAVARQTNASAANTAYRSNNYPPGAHASRFIDACAALAGLRDSRRKVDRDDPHTPSTGDFWTRPLPYGPSLQSTQRPRGLSNRLHRSELQSSIANQLIRLGDSPIAVARQTNASAANTAYRSNNYPPFARSAAMGFGCTIR